MKSELALLANKNVEADDLIVSVRDFPSENLVRNADTLVLQIVDHNLLSPGHLAGYSDPRLCFWIQWVAEQGDYSILAIWMGNHFDHVRHCFVVLVPVPFGAFANAAVAPIVVLLNFAVAMAPAVLVLFDVTTAVALVVAVV